IPFPTPRPAPVTRAALPSNFFGVVFMSCYPPATATQLNREADHEGYCLVADWLNSARLLNWVRDLQACINRVGTSVVSKYAMAPLAQTGNPESNLMA